MTLYDIFGYLLPGLILLVALAIVFWALFFPAAPLRRLEVPVEVAGGWLVLAYIAGHVVHALFNLLDEKLLPAGLRSNIGRIMQARDPRVVAAVRNKLREMTGIDASDDVLLFELTDEFLTQRGVRDNQEIYLYREGFYRNTALALFLLVLALVVRSQVGETLVILATEPHPVTPGMFIFIVTALLLTAALFLMRQRRFLRYRVRSALEGFIAIRRDANGGH